MQWRHWIYTLPLRLRSLFRRPEVERELDEELRFHLEQRVEYEIAAGRTPEEARYAALRAIDGIEQRKEECRDMRHMNLIDNLVRDVRYALRTLARSRGFTLAALLALSLGIGANTAVFSVVNSVLLRPLTYPDPDRLVMLFNSRPQVGIDRGSVSLADFLDWKAHARSFQTLDVINRNRFTLTVDGEAEPIAGVNVTATFFETLRARPLLGRTFTIGEDQPGRAPTVVLSERLWQRRFASDRDILGKQIALNGTAHTVIGVVRNSFEMMADVEAWAIFTLNAPTRRGGFALRGIGRLKPGVTLEQAAAEMDGIAREVERVHPVGHGGLRYPVIPAHEAVVGGIRPLLWVLSGAVLLVLLIAVSNVANLMLARATARQREIAIRLSIGAGRKHLVRQFMTESVILSLAGGALGITLATWGVTALRWLAPDGLPRLNEIGIDGRVLAFTVVASLVSAVLFGLAPALSASTGALSESLKQGGRGGDSRNRARVRGVLVVAQVTLSVMLLIGAGLLIRSFSLLGRVHPGFQAPPDRVLTMSLAPSGSRYREPLALAAYWEQILDRVRVLPGVEAASVSVTIPPDRISFADDFEIEGRPLPEGSEHPPIPAPFVSHDYFRTLGISLLRGRWFDTRDRADTPRVTLISEAMARRHFPGENPLGRRIKHGGPTQVHPWMEIIGVVSDAKYRGLHRENEPAFYQLISQFPLRRAWLLVRTQGDALALAPAVRAEIRNLDPDVPIDHLSTMAQALDESVSTPRFRSLLMTLFASTALLLAAIGIYGVIAYSVAQRTQEIGVRMALGATRSSVLRLVVGQGGRLAMVGIALGLAGAFALTRVLEKMLFGVSASDTVTFAGAALILGVVAILASSIPAFRAARVDPLTALRHD